ncbi:putative T6SS immunity periplasmic lipoprotein [Pantoea sp. B65]|uniref:putative T6SS immunity periplasmic lipoprotein n=1 Tax=Pantoea sp. B65 TaxID=2813359 RepID=UPI0039B601B2
MKKAIITLTCCLLTGCFIHPMPFRTAVTSLKTDGQPCFKIKTESVTANNQSRILSIVVNKEFADGHMHEIWSERQHEFPIKMVIPGQCIPVGYHFRPYQKYSVTIYTMVPPDKVETKRFWRSEFQLQDLQPE